MSFWVTWMGTEKQSLKSPEEPEEPILSFLHNHSQLFYCFEGRLDVLLRKKKKKKSILNYSWDLLTLKPLFTLPWFGLWFTMDWMKPKTKFYSLLNYGLTTWKQSKSFAVWQLQIYFLCGFFTDFFSVVYWD